MSDTPQAGTGESTSPEVTKVVRKRTSKALPKAALECKRPADSARHYGVNGKVLRDFLRRNGIYVSKGDAYDTAAKRLVHERFGKAKGSK